MPSETARLIREATLEAVSQRNRVVKESVDHLAEVYETAGDAIAEHIEKAAGADDRVSLNHLQEVLSEVRKRLQELAEERDRELYRRLEQSAGLGSGAFRSALDPSRLFAVNHQAVAFVRSFTGADGLQLSDRLWRMDKGAVAALTDHLQFAIINGESAHQAMMRSMGRGEGVPAEIARAFNGARAGQLSKQVRSLMTGAADPGNGKGVVYQAERLFRTEINRAHGEAYMGAAFQTDGVVGVRFMLSPRHPRPDICDTYASADEYGLGAGVYPTRSSCPWPAHPNTLSYVEAVFDDEV